MYAVRDFGVLSDAVIQNVKSHVGSTDGGFGHP